MTTPKETLERIRDHSVGTTEDGPCIECEHMIEQAKAAIPIAELEGEAMNLLERYGVFVGIYHSSPDYLKWRNERARLLIQWEALK